MCMNCGCGRPDDDQGNPANITARELRAAADANGQSLQETARHISESVATLAGSGGRESGLGRPAAVTGGQSGARGTPQSES